ncbi:hypothetical protein SPSIL_046880 [Sporomusa silvacetica DSM 10669]|uniref:DUF2229 domain-containing protein n=1 Tax=Sporomusa silvacetica DSM 10669 TaxID=1123289 RepID=A0ABZ3IS40_9FIRM|nr:hypothetical protein [Sporomusa silvacetica]OZC23995.1 hypothetical protein SPSIL_00430 [Sporomusa silvacetica DSM 10669]
MPFYLKCRDISKEIHKIHSVLIVPCRFCPAASLAVREKKFYIELFSKFLRTAVYESYIQELKSYLENNGIRAEVFGNKLPHHFIICMWPLGPRKDLAKHAAEYDAVIVLGCDIAAQIAQDCLESSNCRIIPGMEVEGVMSVIPSFQFPFKISLEMSRVTRVLEYPAEDIPSHSIPKSAPERI